MNVLPNLKKVPYMEVTKLLENMAAKIEQQYDLLSRHTRTDHGESAVDTSPAARILVPIVLSAFVALALRLDTHHYGTDDRQLRAFWWAERCTP